MYFAHHLLGESDDDHEELFAAANYACKARSMCLLQSASLSVSVLYNLCWLLNLLDCFCRSCMFWSILEENGIYICICQLGGHVLLETTGSTPACVYIGFQVYTFAQTYGFLLSILF